MVALLPQKEVIEEGEQLEPGGLNAVVLPFADEVREAKAPEGGYLKAEGKIQRSASVHSSIEPLIYVSVLCQTRLLFILLFLYLLLLLTYLFHSDIYLSHCVMPNSIRREVPFIDLNIISYIGLLFFFRIFVVLVSNPQREERPGWQSPLPRTSLKYRSLFPPKKPPRRGFSSPWCRELILLHAVVSDGQVPRWYSTVSFASFLPTFERNSWPVSFLGVPCYVNSLYLPL